MSNGRYMSAWHRILATRDGNRRSIASIHNPARLATIAPAATPAAATEEYPNFVFGNYMHVYVEHKFQTKETRFAVITTNDAC
jgi:aminocyclopropanecarboxylate oxidase